MNSNFNSPYFYIHFWKVCSFWSISPEADGWANIVGQHSPYSPDYVISDYIVDQIVGAFSIPVKVLAEVVDYQEQRWDWVNNNEDPDSSELFPKASFNYRVITISLGSLERSEDSQCEEEHDDEEKHNDDQVANSHHEPERTGAQITEIIELFSIHDNASHNDDVQTENNGNGSNCTTVREQYLQFGVVASLEPG